MDALHIDDLVAHVLAWHNGHRLARRIAAHHVCGVGVVALPFTPRNAASDPGRRRGWSWGGLRRRGLPVACEPQADWVAAFDQRLIAPLTHRRIAQFALHHGSTERPGPSEWPQRDVQAAANAATESLSVLFLQTACIELGERRLRVLVAAAEPFQVLGHRLWSKMRLVGAAFTLSTVAAMTALGAMPESNSASPSSEPHASQHAAVAKPHAEAAPATATKAAEPAAPRIEAAVASASTASPSVPADGNEPSAPGAHTADDVVRPDIRPRLSAQMREAALHEGQRLRSMGSGMRSTSHVAAGVAYAVMTPVTRSRVASDLRHQLMASATGVAEGPGKPRSELMQVGDGWRVVLWPFNTRTDADTARRLLAERGIRTEVLEF